MACRTVTRAVCLTERWLPFHSSGKTKTASFSLLSSSTSVCGRKGLSSNCGGYRSVRLRKHHYNRGFIRPSLQPSCSYDENQSSQEEQGPPQEAILKAISEVSKAEGRVGQTTNVVIGGTVADDSTNEWLDLDQKVNSYPTDRGFTAIGTGGEDFVQSMVVAVESVLQQPIPEGQVKQKVSSRGKYVSVNIGPVRVSSSEQVQAVYNAMRRDDRMKYFL